MSIVYSILNNAIRIQYIIEKLKYDVILNTA